MKSLLVLGFYPAFVPPSSGGEARLFSIYRELSRHYKITLVTSTHMNVPLEIIEHTDHFKEIRVPKSNEFANAWMELVKNAGDGDLSAPALALSSKSFGQMHEIYLQEYPAADAIIHEHPFLIDCDLFLGWDAKPRLYNAHNVEADLYHAMHLNEHTEISDLVRDCEERMLRHINDVLVCSNEDAERFTSLYPYGNRFSLVANAISAFRLDPLKDHARSGMVFLGSGHLPNVQAADLIVKDIAPRFPDIRFDIVGTCLNAGAYGPNVVAHGRVSDVDRDTLLRNAAFAINPIMMGGGSSLKIADFAAHGLPIISTKLGIRGFDFEAGREYFLLDVDDIEASIDAALRNPVTAAEVGNSARARIHENFTWDHIADKMADAIERALGSTLRKPTYVILNDYDPSDNIGGGGTRIREMSRALAETAEILVLCFTDGHEVKRGRFGGFSMLGIPKTQNHIAYEQRTAAEYYISVADIVASEEVARNSVMTQIYDSASQVADLVICEHPYMVALPRRNGDRFVYSSQNFELGLKRQMLRWHPSRDPLLQSLAQTESFAVGCSALIVAVSDQDAAAIGEAYPVSAPIVVIPNGASEPASFDRDDHADVINAIGPRAVLFLGSGHMPNVEAVQYIIEMLMPQLPDVEFHIVGSVCQSFESKAQLRLKLWGIVDDARKSAICSHCSLAINPMLSGSGSNVKMADYIKNGLHVVSTVFGARGYEEQGEQDLTIVPLEGFAACVVDLLKDARCAPTARTERSRRLVDKLSMFANGRTFAALLLDLLEPRRPRALYVTYRYNYPRRGGGEVYVNRLIEGLANSGYDVDVIAPSVVEIEDWLRFASSYTAKEGIGQIPVGQPRLRTARFPLDTTPTDTSALSKIWKSQARYEHELVKALALVPSQSELGWGWGGLEGGGRWTHRSFGFYVKQGSDVTISGNLDFPQNLYIRSKEDGVLVDRELSGFFSVTFRASDGWVEAELYQCSNSTVADLRPLGAFIIRVDVGGADIVASDPMSGCRNAAPEALFKAHHTAYLQTRHVEKLSLTDLRGPHSSALTQYLDQNMSSYDLLITHNAVFKTATEPLAIAKKNKVKSILIPHTHLEDDYYHFEDIYQAYHDADSVLISPASAVTFLKGIGVSGARYHAPGIDADEDFTKGDVAAFRSVYNDDAPFFLVLGRKAGAKGYLDAIAACKRLPKAWGAKIVMIGPDDDQVPVGSDYVTYLGIQDRSVVRGALMSCVALVNMSQSESFGIVVLEAGLAQAPVLANRACPAFADVVEDDVNGYLVTSVSLEEYMVKILQDPALRIALGRGGRSRALKRDWSHSISQFVDECNGLLSIGLDGSDVICRDG